MIAEKIQYEIDNEYKNIRMANLHEQNLRRRNIESKNENIAIWLNEIAITGINAAKAVLKNTDISEKEKVVMQNKNIIKENTALLKEKIENGLENAGYEKNYLDPLYNCKECKDKGVTEKGKCRCYYEKYRKFAYKISYLDNVDKNECFENFRTDFYSKIKKGQQSDYDVMELNYRACKNYANNFKDKANSILLTGKSGVGKTFLCSSIANKVAENGNVVVYMSAKKFFDVLIKAEFQRGNADNYNKATTEKELAEMIYECDLLIIDDLGTENHTKMTEPEFFDVLNERKFNGRKTIISTNLTQKEISEGYSERIFSRIIENFVTLRCVGDDIRKRVK